MRWVAGPTMVLLLLAAGLAGCAEAPVIEEVALDACDFVPAEVTCDASDGLRLSGNWAGDGWHAISVDGGTFRLHDFSGKAMQVVCRTACNVDLDNVTLTGSDRGALRFSHLVHGEPSLVDSVRIRNLNLVGDAPTSVFIAEAGPRTTIQIDGYTQTCSGVTNYGLALANFSADSQLSNLHIQDCGIGLSLGGMANLQLANVTVHGSEHAIYVTSKSMDSVVTATGLDLQGNQHAIQAHHAAGSQITIVDSVISNNVHGIVAQSGGIDVHATSFAANTGRAVCGDVGAIDATDNWWGVATGPIQAAPMAPNAPLPSVCAGVLTTPHRIQG